MTDIEISKALAISIGWTKNMMSAPPNADVYLHDTAVNRWRVFDYSDTAVIWPIAERYNVFPYLIKVGSEAGKWNVLSGGKDCIADTAAKVVALAVIRMAQAEKKARGK